MFGIFILIAGAATTLVSLGMYSAWFNMMTVAFRFSAIIIFGLASYLLWQRRFRKY